MRPLRTKIGAAIAALFVLQAPLCALACMAPAAIPEVASSDVPPCHKTPAGSETESPTSPRDECGCEDETLDPRLATPDKSFTDIVLAAAKPTPPALQITRASSRVLERPQNIDLPPPDILLLKSTLLL